MAFESVFLFAGGILLFLFSISKLSSSIQFVIGGRIREYIKFSVLKKINGLLSGVLITLIFQSSSATTLLVVSMVSAGLLSFGQSLPVILGADIGTTLTAQLVVWKITDIFPVILIFGLLLLLRSEEKWKRIGETLFYFGLLLFGLFLVTKGTAYLKDETFFSWAILAKKGPIFLFTSTLLFTLVVQSSAIPVSIAIVLCQNNLIEIDSALFVVLGANLGTTGTALLGSVVATRSGKKAALSHVFFKACGVLIFFFLSPIFTSFLDCIPVGTPQKVALSHFLFNFFIAILFYPLLGPVVSLFERLMPEKDRAIQVLPEYLSMNFLRDPQDALSCVKKELSRQMLLSKMMVIDSFDLLYKFNKMKRKSMFYVEMVIDNLQNEILRYLWQISSSEMTEQQSRRLFAYTAIVHDIERIGDHAVNIAEIAEIKKERGTFFSDQAILELENLKERIKKSLEIVTQLIENPHMRIIEELIGETSELEGKIKTALNNHLERFYCKICRREAGPLFVDLLTNIEGIRRHIRSICENLAYQNEEG